MVRKLSRGGIDMSDIVSAEVPAEANGNVYLCTILVNVASGRVSCDSVSLVASSITSDELKHSLFLECETRLPPAARPLAAYLRKKVKLLAASATSVDLVALRAAAERAVMLYTASHEPWWLPFGEESANLRRATPAATHPLFERSEGILLDDVATLGAVAGAPMVDVRRDLLAARGIRQGYKEYLRCSESFTHRKQRLALVVMALDHPSHHSIESLSDNFFFQGPFYKRQAPGERRVGDTGT